MTGSITPLIMLVVFLIGTLLIGLKSQKDNHGIAEYTIGDRTFTTSALIATVFATTYGAGWFIRTVEMTYADGLWYIMFTIGLSIVSALTRIMVSYRIGIFMGEHVPSKSYISMADTIGYVYGKIPRIITALASVGASATSLAIQMTATSRALQICISDVNPSILMVIAASVVVLYSTAGGIQSVTITDMLQCATFTFMIPYLTYKVFHHTGMTVSEIFKSLSQSEKFQLAPVFQNKTKIISLIAACLAYARVSPEVVQRMYMAKNSQQVRDVYFKSGILDWVIVLLVAFLSIVTYTGYSHITNPSMIWPAITNDFSAIFKGFFVISLFAMAMSTADSRLNVASSLFAHDIVNPLCKNKLTDKQQLYLAKVTCFGIGILAILLALYAGKYRNALLRLMLLYFDIGNPVMAAPFFLAIFGFRCKEEIAVLGMVVGIATVMLWNKYIPDINGSFVAMLANGITMFLVHCSLPAKDQKDWQKSNSSRQ